ncbi:MAG: MSCRAMM family protein [Janthinobacterium lividum]
MLILLYTTAYYKESITEGPQVSYDAYIKNDHSFNTDSEQVEVSNDYYYQVFTGQGGGQDPVPPSYELAAAFQDATFPVTVYSYCTVNDPVNPSNTQRRWDFLGPFGDPQYGSQEVISVETAFAAACGGKPNPLRVDYVTVGQSLPDGTQGSADVVAVAKDNTRITAIIRGQITRQADDDGPAAVGDFAVFDNHNDDSPPANRVSHRFDNLLAGSYSFTLTASDNQAPVTGTFTVTKKAGGSVRDLAFGAEPKPEAPTLGMANGRLTVYTTGGRGGDGQNNIEVTLSQTGGTPVSAQYPAATGTGVIEGLQTGLYSLTARVVGSLPPEIIPAAGDPDKLVEIPRPALAIGDQLTFVPWVQSKLARAATAGVLRPTLELSATLTTDGIAAPLPTSTTAEIYGPGDVLGINQQAILGTVPVPDATGFSPTQLAAIEFKEEDFPWRYSRPTAEGTPLPWCFLLVLKEGEYEALPLTGQPLPSINILAGAPYPGVDAAQQALWAHVQINASLGDPGDPGDPGATPPVPPTPPRQPTGPEIADFLTHVLPANPDLAYSRVFSPRRLEADTAYRAFLLPAVEAGRLAGLGLPYTEIVQSAIPTDGAARAFPVYFQWAFATGTEEDFGDLARQLRPANDATGAATAPTLAVTLAATTYQLPMPGLLTDGAAPLPAAPPLAVAQDLYDLLAPGFTLTRPAGGRPVVTPPLYGRAYMVTSSLIAPRTEVASSWKHTVNLDPRYRALAALGAQVVQENQEEYVRRAWDQVRDILLANEKLRGVQYGLRTTAGLRAQHLPLDAATAPTTNSGWATRQAFAQRVAAAPSEAGGITAAPAVAPASTALVLADYGLHLTGLALSRVRVRPAVASAPLTGLTAREVIRRSSTPLAAFSPAFRRIMKPFGRYQIGEAGRPLRPTQPAPAPDANGLRQTGTSLRQRDTLLSDLAVGRFTTAPPRAEQVRVYQFEDAQVDALLGKDLDPTRPLRPAALSDQDALIRFNAAYAVFKTLSATEIVGFLKPQHVRPALLLTELKADVVTGTQPGPAFRAKVQQVAPTVIVPPFLPPGDFEAMDFEANDFYVDDAFVPVSTTDFSADFSSDFNAEVSAGSATALATPNRFSAAAAQTAITNEAVGTFLTTAATTATTTSGRVVETLPLIQQTKVFPVFKDAMGEPLRQRHPELFVPGLADFPTGGIAVLDVNQAFIEAYMVGLNHALGSELLWRGFPVELRGTFFQQFWDVSEQLNTQLGPGQLPTAAQEAQLLDIRPLDQWVSNPLGQNAPLPGSGAAAAPLRLALRSELLRRYPTLVLGLQPQTNGQPDEDPAKMVYPRQRLPVGQDVVVVTFDVPLEAARAGYYLVLLERPGQPKFGLSGETARTAAGGVTGADPTADPLGWDDLTWDYLGTLPGGNLVLDPVGKPHATAEPASVAHLADSAAVAYALFQEPVLAAIPARHLLS